MTSEKNNPANATTAPTLFFIVGLMGCGKSYWGKYLCNKNNFLFIDLDKAIEQYVKMSISDIFNSKGETFFRDTETEVLKKIKEDSYKNSKKNIIIATGGGTACHNNNTVWMNKNGVTIWLNESIEKMESRVFNNKSKRPLLNNIADKDLLNYLEALLQSRKIFYSQSTHCLNPGEVLENNLQKIIDIYV